MSELLRRYPELDNFAGGDGLTDRDYDVMETHASRPMDEIGHDLEAGIRIGRLGLDHYFRYWTNAPSEADPRKAIIIPGEYANGITPAAVTRAMVIRDAVAPDATAILLPNSTHAKDNLVLTPREQKKLAGGDPSPMTDRLFATLGGTHEDIIGWGPSQDADVLSAFAAHPNAPPMAIAVAEATNVEWRRSPALVADFVSSGGHLKSNIGLNALDIPPKGFSDYSASSRCPSPSADGGGFWTKCNHPRQSRHVRHYEEKYSRSGSAGRA